MDAVTQSKPIAIRSVENPQSDSQVARDKERACMLQNISTGASQDNVQTIFHIEAEDHAHAIVKELSAFQNQLSMVFSDANTIEDIEVQKNELETEINNAIARKKLDNATCAVEEIKKTLLDLETVLLTQRRWPEHDLSKLKYADFLKKYVDVRPLRMAFCVCSLLERGKQEEWKVREQDIFDLLAVEYSSSPKSARDLVEKRHQFIYSAHATYFKKECKPHNVDRLTELATSEEKVFRNNAMIWGLPIVDIQY